MKWIRLKKPFQVKRHCFCKYRTRENIYRLEGWHKQLDIDIIRLDIIRLYRLELDENLVIFLVNFHLFLLLRTCWKACLIKIQTYSDLCCLIKKGSSKCINVTEIQFHWAVWAWYEVNDYRNLGWTIPLIVAAIYLLKIPNDWV